MKISLISTVLNEEKTIMLFLESLYSQTRLPDEIIIVDGGSADKTLSVISNSQFPISNKKVKIIVKKGNRAVGRNEAIKNATGEIILCSDAGCILDKDWVRQIIEPFRNLKVDVVAGFYKGIYNNIFEKCLIPYVLVMPDRVNHKTFLPASRSMAFKKSIWEKANGFDENLSYNEDYAFSQKLKQINAKIVFKKKAVVSWLPSKNLKQAFIMFFRFALGDAQAKIFRPKVLLIFTRYLIGLILLISYLATRSTILFYLLLLLIAIYLAWSIIKNYRYVNNWKAILILPILQITTDISAVIGTSIGILISFEK